MFVEVNNNFLVLLLEQMGRFFGFQMDVLKKFAHFGQLNIALAIDFELKPRERGRKECGGQHSSVWLSGGCYLLGFQRRLQLLRDVLRVKSLARSSRSSRVRSAKG